MSEAMTDPNRQRALLAGHEGEHQDAIDDLMELWGADSVKEDGEFLYLMKDGARVGFPFERRKGEKR